ncbi:MAG: YitT family protein, partial [Erysipelotrichaceae bacterium]|nr:YitT family protein [Erysipelotrichaceae bacterium]
MNYSGRKSTVIRDYILLGIGTLLIALAVKEYLIPCQIVTGSVSGLALLFNEVFGIDTSLLTLLMNLSCLLIGT